MLKGKKVIVLGERDDVTGDVIQKCLEAADATIIYSTTACFV